MTERLEIALDRHSGLIDLGPLLCDLVQNIKPEYRAQAYRGLGDFAIALSAGEISLEDIYPNEAPHAPATEPVVVAQSVQSSTTPEPKAPRTSDAAAPGATRKLPADPKPAATVRTPATVASQESVSPSTKIEQAATQPRWPITAKIPEAYDRLQAIDPGAFMALRRTLGREEGEVHPDDKESLLELLTTLVISRPLANIDNTTSEAVPPVACRALYDLIGYNVPQGSLPKRIDVIDRLLRQKLENAGITAAEGVEMVLVKLVGQGDEIAPVLTNQKIASQTISRPTAQEPPEQAAPAELDDHSLKLKQQLSMALPELTDDEISFLLTHTHKHTDKAAPNNSAAKSACRKVKAFVDRVQGQPYAVRDEAKVSVGHIRLLRALVGSQVDAIPPQPGKKVADRYAKLTDPRAIRVEFGKTQLPDYNTLLLESFETLAKAASNRHKYRNLRVS